MTQKSYARQQRDAQEKARKTALQGHLKGNRNWDDLQTRYSECCQLLREPTNVVEILKDNELISYIPADQVQVLRTNNSMLARDLRELLNELKQIYSKHGNRVGSASEADVMEGFAIYELYVLWLERYNSLIPPTVAHILEITNMAEERRRMAKAAQAQAQAQNPADTAVIDVEAKEVPVATGENNNAA